MMSFLYVASIAPVVAMFFFWYLASDVPVLLPMNRMINQQINQSIYLTTFLFTYLSTCLFTYLLVYLPTYPSIYLPTCLFTYLSIYLSTYLSIYYINTYQVAMHITAMEGTGPLYNQELMVQCTNLPTKHCTETTYYNNQNEYEDSQVCVFCEFMVFLVHQIECELRMASFESSIRESPSIFWSRCFN